MDVTIVPDIYERKVETGEVYDIGGRHKVTTVTLLRSGVPITQDELLVDIANMLASIAPLSK